MCPLPRDQDAAATPAPERAALAEHRRRLEQAIGRHRRLLVAFSAGVDSTLLLKVAVDVLGPEQVLAVTGESESVPERELAAARDLAQRFGARHRFLRTQELQNERYAANPFDRCYYCKSELFARLRDLAAMEGFDAIADGTNLDDGRDVRPGGRAGRENDVVSPLLEAGLGKRDIRALSRELGLPTWDKPEMACLASRLPYGSPIDAEKLHQVDRAEESLRACGILGARVRHHGDIARLELQSEDLARLADPGLRARVVAGVRAAGFAYVTLDLEAYRRGRMNEVAGDTTSRREPQPDPGF